MRGGAFVAFVVFGLAVPTGAAPPVTLEVDPTTAAPGASVTVTGSAYTPDRVCTIHLTPGDAPDPDSDWLGACTVAWDGTFTSIVEVPDLDNGVYTIYVCNTPGGAPCHASSAEIGSTSLSVQPPPTTTRPTTTTSPTSTSTSTTTAAGATTTTAGATTTTAGATTTVSPTTAPTTPPTVLAGTTGTAPATTPSTSAAGPAGSATSTSSTSASSPDDTLTTPGESAATSAVVTDEPDEDIRISGITLRPSTSGTTIVAAAPIGETAPWATGTLGAAGGLALLGLLLLVLTARRTTPAGSHRRGTGWVNHPFAGSGGQHRR